MQDIFYEESVATRNVSGSKIKLRVFRIASIFSTIMGILFVILLFFSSSLFEIVLSAILMLLSFFSAYYYNRKKDTFNIDFDYTFVTGSIRISKVLNNKRRKNIVNFNTTEIITIGKANSQTYLRLTLDKSNKLIVATTNDTPDENKDFYYIHFSVGGERKLIVLECTELFMYHVLKHSNKSVLEQDFNK